MTRKEEIKKGAFDAFPNEGWERQRVSFVQGALWADEHPKEGLVDIDKVCEWLKEMMQGHIVLEVLTGEHYEADLIKDFKKAMEE